MRFLMLMIPSQEPGGDWMPTPAAMDAMGRYNDELKKAGVLLSLLGLHPPGDGARVRFGNGKPTVADGPFAETREVVGGYWMIQVKGRDEAIAWARRCPAGRGAQIEIRRVLEVEDFPADVQAVMR